ncbi:MAG: TrkA C-terminal domain-containing protein [Actinomycetota bacterium]|uniref:RCK C-terminal domain-containing protein n=1 Tax=marine metagenome TaxID=408172 RepID=A0A381QJ43_9ZZZZ|nr:TrkA C-terminal domain-containing protein [Actinomycetota bacterium]MEC9315933.1 TrkA C-terminal domain-containing protein [Actinomycetota bacterium]MED5552838.1 TrkA C-terminal domain-containing protein [Actinomycetota bacterium]MEE3187914.1 TrkA C-terminal domain-containing protein [Actinomycetota bacterium]|tara:strand:+ start:955 stop:2178 length:1224 start_codon:yes stop_codon:yes gene_type:complete
MDDKPRNLKTLLAEAKDASELMVDLAYAALYFDDEGMAESVLGLEEEMSDLVHEMRSLAMLAVRHPREVDGMSSVLQVVSSIEQIANAAVDIAKIVLRQIGIPRALVVDLGQAAEVSHRLVVADGSHLANRPLADMELPVVVGMRVVAIQRGRRWLTDVGGEDIVEAGDALFMRGEPAGIVRLRELAAAPPWVPPEADTSDLLTDLDRAVDTLVEMKNISETAIGLAYSALVLHDLSLAREVRALEERLDEMKVSLQTWVLRAAAYDMDPSQLRGLLHLAEAAEDIGDQALQIVSLVLDQEDVHPVLALALGDTHDVVVQVPVAPGSTADDATLGSLGLAVDPGYHVLAVRRAAAYIYNPGKTVTLRAGDELLASGPEEGRERLAALCGYSIAVDEETGMIDLTPAR